MSDEQKKLYLELLLLDCHEAFLEGQINGALEFMWRAKHLAEESAELLSDYNIALMAAHEYFMEQPIEDMVDEILEQYEDAYMDESYYIQYLQIWNEIVEGKLLTMPLVWEDPDCDSDDYDDRPFPHNRIFPSDN